MCRVRFGLWLNAIGQKRHGYGRSPVCTRRWRERSPLDLKQRRQTLHAWSRSPSGGAGSGGGNGAPSRCTQQQQQRPIHTLSCCQQQRRVHTLSRCQQQRRVHTRPCTGATCCTREAASPPGGMGSGGGNGAPSRYQQQQQQRHVHTANSNNNVYSVYARPHVDVARITEFLFRS